MNIRDIARIAGVSTSTVSKIVNGKDSSISEETRKKVLTIVKEYHYKPYASASQRTRSYTIGVLLRSPISFDSTLDGIIQAAQNAGYATDAYNSYSDPERELKNIAAICGRNVDGVIWEPATPDSLASVISSSLIENLLDKGITVAIAWVIVQKIPRRFLSQYAADSMGGSDNDALSDDDEEEDE